MKECSLTYGSASLPTTSLPPSLPVYRELHLSPLASGSSYRVYLQCQDKEGRRHSSNTVHFTTGMLPV